MKISADKNYSRLLSDIKHKIRSAQIHTSRTVNRGMVGLYYIIGKIITEKQRQFGWGKSVVEQLAKDLRREYKHATGFSVQNLWYMRQLYVEYKNQPKLQQLVGEIPWGQNILILSKVKDKRKREYYLKATREMCWSRNSLLHHIATGMYERQHKYPKLNNFKNVLSHRLAEQADEAMKSTYNLEFLRISECALEKTIENKMVEKVKNFILELGYGFAYIGNQHKLKLGVKEYSVDLLFYHRKLKCLVAIDLKAGGFIPEHAGKMNFYLNLLDDYERIENENPSIGIILCAEKNQVEVEYSLKGINKPIGVADYRLTKQLPKKLMGKLPSRKELKESVL